MTGKTNLLVAHLRNLDIIADRNYFSYLDGSLELTINNLSKQPSTFGVENRTLSLLIYGSFSKPTFLKLVET